MRRTVRLGSVERAASSAETLVAASGRRREHQEQRAFFAQGKQLLG